MASAALQLHPRPQPSTVPPGGPRRPPHPQLRVIEGGRAPSTRALRATFLRRRLMVALVAAALVAAIALVGAALAGTAGGGHPSAAAGASSSGVHVVQPGDTLWSIAADAAPQTDVRITVDRIAELNGGAPLAVGQRLVLP